MQKRKYVSIIADSKYYFDFSRFISAVGATDIHIYSKQFPWINVNHTNCTDETWKVETVFTVCSYKANAVFKVLILSCSQHFTLELAAKILLCSHSAYVCICRNFLNCVIKTWSCGNLWQGCVFYHKIYIIYCSSYYNSKTASSFIQTVAYS